ncbi:MAG TPA: TIGR03620 family F420-dependent LLM class oxidoreductase [Acidimicrobiia bacterium]|nr:TIGR03620 family F420-dependent LLM class oxidoreductase [Acidimicrobiia bacterium]
MELPPVGIWDRLLRFGDEDEIQDSAAEAEELGYGALWIPDTGGDVCAALNVLLWATRRITVGTGVLNLWMQDAIETAARWHRLVRDHDRRPVLGIGVSHAPLVDAVLPGQFKNPLEATASYLDELDAANPPVPVDDRLLAALRPRMLELARDRCAGAFPYHMPPEHTERARAVIGPDRRLVVEQAVALGSDRDAARTAARQSLAMYLALPNYVNAWRWLGFSEEDVADGGSDRFVDAVVACGDVEAISGRVKAQRDAGADHVCIQVVADDLAAARTAWRELAPALL